MGLVLGRAGGQAAAPRPSSRHASLRRAVASPGRRAIRTGALRVRGRAGRPRRSRCARAWRGRRGIRARRAGVDERGVVLLLRSGRQSARVLVPGSRPTRRSEDPARLTDVPRTGRPRPRCLRARTGGTARRARPRSRARGSRSARDEQGEVPQARARDAGRVAPLQARRRVRALPRSDRADRRGCRPGAARRDRARSRRAQRRLAARDSRCNSLRRATVCCDHRGLRLPAARAGGEGAGGARQDRGGRLGCRPGALHGRNPPPRGRRATCASAH